MSFRLVPKSVTSNDLERRNGPYLSLFQRIRCLFKLLPHLLTLSTHHSHQSITPYLFHSPLKTYLFHNLSHHRLDPSILRTDSTDFTTGPFL